MNNREAIDSLKDILAEATSSDAAVCYVTDRDAEPLRMAIGALEKQIPKEPTYEGDGCSGGELATKEKTVEPSEVDEESLKTVCGTSRLSNVPYR